MNFKQFGSLLPDNPLCGINTYKDELNLATGVCTRKIKKLVLDGTENWTYRSGDPANVFFMYLPTAKTGEVAMSNAYPYYSGTDFVDMNDKEFAIIRSNLAIRNSDYQYESQFKAYLAQQYANGTPVTVWYILSTPTTETITVPSGLSGTEEGYLNQSGTPTPTNPVYPTANEVRVWNDVHHYIHNTSTDTITTPADIYANDTTVTVGLKGQMEQSGTPTPDNPIMPQGTGGRTGNLAYGRIDDVNIDANGTIGILSGFDIAIGRVESGVTYTANTYVFAFYTNEPTIGSASYDGSRIVGTVGTPSTFTAPITGYVAFRLNPGEQAMLNTGSTALPYEPYGYKIPISSGGVNLAWTGWAEDFVQRINDSTRAYINNDILSILANVGHGEYDTKYIFKAEWKENTQYTFNLTYRRDSIYSNAAMLQITYTDGTTTMFPRTINDGEWHNIYVTSEAGKTIKYLNALYTSSWLEIKIDSFFVYEGTVEKPYEPYIYLGEVQTTRRVKKLVITGNENFGNYTNPPRTGVYLDISELLSERDNGYCTHFVPVRNPNQYAVDGITFGTSNPILYITFSSATAAALNLTDLDSIKAWFRQQYAAGTPVTVWYVLATATTGIVNEPLRKIGDYADTVSGITIPTIAGANTISVDTTLQPSEVTVNYKGWHPVADVHERESGAWT